MSASILQRKGCICIAPLVLASSAIGAAEEPAGDPAATEVWNPEPPVVAPGAPGAPPADAVVLFDGSDFSAWRHEDGSAVKWRLDDGAMTVVGGAGNIATQQRFGDVQLHIEWRTPAEVRGEGQLRGNSGVFLQKRYEVQVLDSWQNRTYANGQAASIYKQHIPLVNASRPPDEWQAYDIVFRAPVFAGDGSLERAAYVTVFHNGILVQDHVRLDGPTEYIGEPAYEPHPPKLPLMLQDHGDPVSFRNIWVRELSVGQASSKADSP